MIDLVEGRTLRCELNGERTHDGCAGICYLEGADISGGRYAEAERQAAADGATISGVYPLPGYCRPR